ncbi:MAG: hypothetical protein BRC33_04665 [Cyanobacteria bacterium SW_9_44_58]|nr:MAG: hypothetical protein BRC33_04665 [Cyanobacteria bacterium SW_9_44_58]
MIRYLFVSLSVSVSLALVFNLGGSPASSQTTAPEQDDPYQSSERDTFSSGLGDNISPFDLYHRLNNSQGKSLEDFRQQQQRSLDSAASKFRQQQQQLLQQQSSSSSEDSPIKTE